jgi:hypothetical protein
MGRVAASHPDRRAHLFEDLLLGHAFRVCADRESVQAALDVRHAVYRSECGYSVPIPDDYDARSWFLLAEDAASGRAIGSMRLTPRSAGSLEAEEYFDLPLGPATHDSVEISRFAILRDYRHGTRFLPAVALGLFKLAGKFIERLHAEYVVICSKPERVLTYQWLRFDVVGQRRPYVKLKGAEHELMVCDVRGGPQRYRDHRYWDCFFEVHHPQILVGEPVPGLGLDCLTEAPPPARRVG